MIKYKLTVMIVLMCFTAHVASQRTILDNFLTINIVRAARNLMTALIGSTSEINSRNYLAARNLEKLQDPIPENVSFPCNIPAGRSETVPTSVDKLRPGDIDVIGAMGDSLTAGFGIYASDLRTIFIENRGSSALGGGQGTWRNTLTIPNILKVFNPNIFGYCQSDKWNHEEGSEFNVAESAAMSRDMPFMAKTLVRRMLNDNRVDLLNHWKLVNILIGANDFCSGMCWDPSPEATLDSHKRDLIESLRTLRDNLPRTLVNIIAPPHMNALVEQKGRSRLCNITTTAECSCFFGLRNRSKRDKFYDIIQRFQNIDEEIAAYPEFQRDDFTVVVQPLFTNWTWPELPNGDADFRYMSSDCFHLSQRGNARLAYSVWRNLLEPVGKKSRDWADVETLPCPTEERPYIATLENSRL